MEASGLLGVSRETQLQVDAVLARFFTLSKNRAAAFGPQDIAPLIGDPELTDEQADAVLGRVK